MRATVWQTVSTAIYRTDPKADKAEGGADYKAKISDVDEAAQPSGELLVHFKGWNSKFARRCHVRRMQ